MPFAIFSVILFAAVLHASWNAIVKGAGDKLLTTVLVAGSASLLASAILPALRQPDPSCWPLIVASALFQTIYFILVARTYEIADMSVTYPLMRGSAPVLVAVVSDFGLGVKLPTGIWIGVGMISIGILSTVVDAPRGSHKGITLALLNAFVISAYTLIDGVGVRRSGAPAAYTLWIFLATGIPLVIWALRTRKSALFAYARINWRFGLLGGVGTIASYGLALWAMTIVPVAAVAALRETSILFGAMISYLLLKEHIGLPRIIAACAIAAGAAVLRLA